MTGMRGGIVRWRVFVCAWLSFCLCCLCLSTAQAQVSGLSLAGREPADGSLVQVVNVGLMADYAPFHQWPAGGEPSGYDVELLRELEAAGFIRIHFFRFERFSDLLAAMDAGRIQVAPAMGLTLPRLKLFRFTRPYVVQQQVLVARTEMTSVSDVPDLAGRRLAIVTRFASADTAQQRFPQAAFLYLDSEDEALDAVEQGRADVAFVGLPSVLDRLRKDRGLRIMRTYAFPSGQLRIAGPKHQVAVIEYLDSLLEARTPEQNDALVRKWLSDLEPPPPIPTTVDGQPPLKLGFLRGDPAITVDRAGQPDGMAVDVMKAMAERAGLSIAGWESFEAAAAIPALLSGKIDLLVGLTETQQRRETTGLVFVGPYQSNHVALVSRNEHQVGGLDELQGARVALVVNYFARDYLAYSQPDLRIVDCADVAACFAMVERGQADVTLASLEGLQERLARRGSDLVISGFVRNFMDEDSIAMAGSHVQLAKPLREALDYVKRYDLPMIERARAERQRAGGIDWEQLAPWIAGTVMVLMLVALAVWWHLRQLRQEVSRRQLAQEQSEAYLAFMTHEVRNALQSVVGASALLDDLDREPSSAAERHHVVRLLTRTSRSTMALMDALMDRHRFASGEGRLHYENVNVAELVDQLVQDIQPAAEAKHLTLTAKARSNVQGEWRVDPLRVQQVLRNLIVNAVKFTREGSIEVMVSAGHLSPRATAMVAAGGLSANARMIRVTVRDTGDGMTAEQRAHLFERFHSTGGDRPGTGLGLALSKELAEAMGGSLTLSKDTDQGSEFVLSFVAEPVIEPSTQPTSAHQLMRVLVVGSSPVYGLLLRRAFAARGVHAVLAESVRDAAGELRRAHTPATAFDLVLCDMHLVDGQVSNVMGMLRDWPQDTDPPKLMALTQDPADEASNYLRQSGALEVLSKRTDVHQLVERIRKAYEGFGRREKRSSLPI